MENSPRLLLIESSTPTASVALADGDQCVASLTLEVEKGHARLIAPMIRQVMNNLRWGFEDIDAVVVSIGPGSYTGLRVGLSTAKGMAVAAGCPIIAVNSLQALAGNVLPLARELNAPIVAMTDARRMEVYIAMYDQHGAERHSPQAMIMEAGSLSDWLQEGPHLFVGNGVEKCRHLFVGQIGCLFLPGQAYEAKGMIPKAQDRFQKRQFEDTEALDPLYLKSVRITKPKNRLV